VPANRARVDLGAQGSMAAGWSRSGRRRRRLRRRTCGCTTASTSPWRSRKPEGDLVMKLSARNQLKGRIVEVRKGQTTAHLRLDVNGTMITASITNEAVDELRLANGQDAYAVIKASDVMIATD
jgi:molybdopterin-binding protein